MSTLFFISDTHWDHNNIIKHCNRPFSSVEEMNKTMIDNWNSVVGPNDIVYHLGDVAFRTHPKEFLKRLNGRIRVIMGNHDSQKQLIECVDDGIIDLVQSTYYQRWQGHKFFLSHYAHRVWRNSHHGSFHLYGHSHGDLEGIEWGKSMDVGVDCWKFTPVHVNKVIEVLDQRDIVDHHAS